MDWKVSFGEIRALESGIPLLKSALYNPQSSSGSELQLQKIRIEFSQKQNCKILFSKNHGDKFRRRFVFQKGNDCHCIFSKRNRRVVFYWV